MKNIILAILCIGTLFVSSCSSSSDSSSTVSANGTIDLAINLKNPTLVSERQRLYVGLYKENNYEATVSKPLESKVEQTINIRNIPNGTFTLKIEAKQGSNVKSTIYTQPVEITDQNQTVEIDANLASFQRINSGLFKQCANCHDINIASENGNLALNEKVAYNNLVNIDAKNAPIKRVEPYKTAESFLIKVVKKENLPFDHQFEVLAPEQLKMLEIWIDEGALNN